jgi:hypothetical protein
VIKATQAVPSHNQHREANLNGQIFDKVIRPHRHHPAADTFDKYVINPGRQFPKRIEQRFDVDIHGFDLRRGQRRGRCFQPKRINFVCGQTVRARGQQKLGVPAITTANRFESGARSSICAQQPEQLHGSVRFSNTGIGAGNEEAHNADLYAARAC